MRAKEIQQISKTKIELVEQDYLEYAQTNSQGYKVTLKKHVTELGSNKTNCGIVGCSTKLHAK